ncbi:MAG TPA: glycoside hydrolase family 48 protein, partial [Polyangiaceae bacterium]|nr:glycoside hydrolase family 48 protein [Polyangiaceae bacterium]
MKRAATLALTFGLTLGNACAPRAPSSAAGTSAEGAPEAASTGSSSSDAAATPDVAPPPAPPEAPTPPGKTNDVHVDRFLELWTAMHKLSNGYFSKEGVPYHSVETLIAEAPDYGHETTSEAFSYWLWLEAMYGKVTKDWSHLDRAWSTMEYYVIPQKADQPTNSGYNPGRAATFAPEMDRAEDYPVPLDPGVQVGADPIGDELRQTYGSPDIYAMHWLLDVDNWYGFGRRGERDSRVAFINSFQRGPEESVYETVTQPCWEEFKWGGPNGFLDMFQKAGSFARQWKYTNAPDADARAVQAVYWAKVWADENSGSEVVDKLGKKAAKMGDFVRYALFDKYFKT